jgi:DNA polymerase III delta prime subunit
VEDAAARVAWDARFEAARASIPAQFAWVAPIALDFSVKPPVCRTIPEDFAAFLPWLTTDHVQRLYRAWRSTKNVLLCGPIGSGKTSLMILLARWTLHAARYDAPAIRERRAIIASEAEAPRTPAARLRPVHPEPEHLPQVRAAQHARFVSATDLLDAKGEKPNGDAVEAAKRARLLFLDEIGKELKGAVAGSYLTALRSPAVDAVIENAWNTKQRWIGTTRFRPEALSGMYDLGTYRRLVEEESGVLVFDLEAQDWAGAHLADKARRAQSGRARR